MSASPTTTPCTLLTFAPMIDSEFSRFVLNHYKVPYRKERHLFGCVSLLALGRGGTLQIPLLTGAGPALAGPEAMVDHFEKSCAPDRRLILEDEQSAAQIAADMARFHGTLGDATAVLGYYHLLPQRALMTEVFARGVPPGEARLLGSFYPALAGLFHLLLRLNAEHAGEALDQTCTLFEETDRRLADGRTFLVGNRLSLSDIALATAAAPVLLPPNYGSPMPALEQMPPALQAIIGELRSHDTARFVDGIFRQYRISAYSIAVR
jgi:glutathione S-transferase